VDQAMKQRKDFNNIEELLQAETNGFEMYPSDAVWGNIAQQVQEKKRWPALTIIAFFIIVALSISTFLNYPPDNLVAKIKYRDSMQLVQQNTIAENIATAKKENFIEAFAKQTATTFTTSFNTEKIEEENTIASNFTKAATIQLQAPVLQTIQPITQLQQSIQPIAILAVNDANQAIETPAENTNKGISNIEALVENLPLVYANGSGSVAIDKFRKTKPKWSVEFYFTPSFSYRKLIDDSKPTIETNNVLASTALLALNITTPLNELIRHKPAVGFEAGAAIGYSVSPNFSVTTGVQFNMRKYYIDAFVNNNQVNIATINNGNSPIRVLTDLSNTTGNTHALLNNQLYQLSIPIGINWKALNYKKLSVHLAASVQPTLTLNKDLYLLSTDYKYYASGESFLRTFNINSSADIRFQYNTHKSSSFYIGPQIRFQHLPTYNKAYSIKEYRWDYGVRLGFIKQLKN
jgi:hypothetical protein